VDEHGGSVHARNLSDGGAQIEIRIPAVTGTVASLEREAV